MEIFVSVMMLICGFIIGLLVGKYTSKSDGLFIIDDSDDETTRWTLDIKYDPKDIQNKKEIRLKVRKMEKEGV